MEEIEALKKENCIKNEQIKNLQKDYFEQNQKLYKVTKDHTLVNLLVQAGNLTEEEAKSHPKKNVLMRALGATEKAELDIFDVDVNNAGIMLCSDGLTSMLSYEQIEKVLNEDLSTEAKVQKLINKCNKLPNEIRISLEKGRKINRY